MTMTNRCLGMTRPLMVTMTIILTFEYYGRIIKLNIYHTYANDIHYFEVTYQSNLFAHPIQDCRNILHCCKCLDHYNHHCLYMKKLWKKQSQSRSGIFANRIKPSHTKKSSAKMIRVNDRSQIIMQLLPKQSPSASQPWLHWQN